MGDGPDGSLTQRRGNLHASFMAVHTETTPSQYITEVASIRLHEFYVIDRPVVRVSCSTGKRDKAIIQYVS